MSGRLFNQAQVRKVGEGHLVFAEFELFTHGGVNVAPLGTATATSTGWDGPPENAIDGSSGMNINDNTVYHSANTNGDIWTVTFDRAYTQSELSRVTLLARDAGANHNEAAIELLSTDGQGPLLLGTTADVPTQTFNVPQTVTWVLDAESRYEISSKLHLIQLMHSGTLYTNQGSVPPSFFDANYIQTVDIDLEGDSFHILPICYATYFQGTYDGNNLTISNWSYVDANFGTGIPGAHIGLFGFVQSGATVKNVRLDGVCTLSGWKEDAGFVVGKAWGATLSNIDCNVEAGSYMTQGDEVVFDSYYYAGGVVGHLSFSSTATALTFRGEMGGFIFSTNVERPGIGGVVGGCMSSTATLLRNLAKFTTPIGPGYVAGGVIGFMLSSSFTKGLNAMIGDFDSRNSSNGGVVGSGSMTTSNTIGELVNSMKGNIPSDSYSGGVLGGMGQAAGTTIYSLMNYMAGNMSTTFGTRSGGIVGYGTENLNFATSINAMNGEVYRSVYGRGSQVPDLAFVDTSFGLTYTVDAYSTTTPITGLPTDPSSGLPIFDLTATDPDGVTHTFEFVFGNLPPSPSLYCNRSINDAFEASFPSAVGGTGLTINGAYTTDANGIVLSGTDNTLKTSTDITFQTIGLWFRFNGSMPAAAYNLFDARPGTDSFSNLAPGVSDRARSDLLSLVSTNSGWVTSLTTTMRYSPENNYLMWTRNKGNVVRFDLSNFNTSSTYSNTQVNIFVASTGLDLRDFDYRHIDDSYYGFEWGDGNKLSKSVGGVQSYITAPWPAGHLQGIRYRKSDDKFIFALAATNKVYMMDPTTEVFTELNSNISDPVALAIGDGDTIYYQTSGRIIMSLDLSSTSNTPVQVSFTPTGNNRNIDYYNGKVYVTSGTSFIEVDVATGAQFTISGITIEKTFQAIDPVNARVFSVKQSGESIEEHGYDFKGADGPGYTEATGTTPIANTFINGELSDIKSLQFQQPNELISLVVTLTNPVTGPLTLFGDTSNTGSPDVTVDSVMIYPEPISEPAYLHDLYLAIVYPLTITPRALNVSVVVGPVAGATAYRLTSQKTGSSREKTVKSNFTDLEQTIKNLEPDTEYTFRLYSTTGADYSLVDESVLSTLENSASNYDKNEFVGTSGRFDLSSLDSSSVGFFSEVMNEVFTTGDEIDIVVPGGRGTKVSKFVNRGGNVSLSDSEALVAPFSKDAGAGQAVTLTLSDSSTVAIAYDETTEAITVEATSYTPGESFVLDGKKATIVDI